MLSADERWFEPIYVDIPNLQYGGNGLFAPLAQLVSSGRLII